MHPRPTERQFMVLALRTQLSLRHVQDVYRGGRCSTRVLALVILEAERIGAPLPPYGSREAIPMRRAAAISSSPKPTA